MLKPSTDQIITSLRRARLYNGKYGYSDAEWPVKSINSSHLLYWNNLKLFDFKENPAQDGSWRNSGTELHRAISLKINLGKLTKKYGDCLVTIPPMHVKLLWGEPPEIPDYDIDEISSEEVNGWIIRKLTKTYTTATPKAINLPPQLQLKDVFMHYIESELQTDDIKRSQIAHPDQYGYKMEIPGTNYILKFFITGSIYSIKVTNPTSIQDILKMNHWVSIELKDIVEKASICRKVEREYEQDYDELESETTYECTV